MKVAPHRLANLCHELGIFTDELYASIIKRVGPREDSQKSLVDILTSEVSTKTLKEFASYEIKMFHNHDNDNGKDPNAKPPLNLKPDEIYEILKRNQPDLKILEQSITDYDPNHQNEIDSRIADQDSESEEYKVQIYRTLVDRGTLSMRRLSEMIASHNHQNYEAIRLSIIKRILEQNKILEADQFDKALDKAISDGVFLSRVLEKEKMVKEKQLRDSMLKPLDLPWIKMDKLEVSEDVLNLLPEDIYHREVFLITESSDSVLKVAVPDPMDFEIADILSMLTGKNIELYFAPEEKIIKYINTTFDKEFETDGEVETTEPEVYNEHETESAVKADVNVSEQDLNAQATVADTQSTVKLVRTIVDKAVQSSATDIHIEPQLNSMRIRYRIDGTLHKVMNVPKNMSLSVVSRIKVLCDMDVTERRRPQDGHFNLSIDGNKYDFRVSSIPTNHGEKLVLRALKEHSAITQLTDLGMSTNQQDTMQQLLQRTYGCILTTGPTGSGKTTTLYTALNMLNNEESNLITIEDPTEYQVPGINQIQVDVKANVTFANGLRACLRQDPDVIMVGEIRDSETAQVATRAALTGHLVLSTMHTNTTVGAITTLVHMGVPPLLISSALAGVISQRLVRRICSDCKYEIETTEAILNDLGLPPKSDMKMYAGKGCENCWGTGYSGREGIYEILVIDNELRNMINANATESNMLEYAIASGMETLKKNAIRKIEEGKSTPDEILKTVFMNN